MLCHNLHALVELGTAQNVWYFCGDIYIDYRIKSKLYNYKMDSLYIDVNSTRNILLTNKIDKIIVFFFLRMFTRGSFLFPFLEVLSLETVCHKFVVTVSEIEKTIRTDRKIFDRIAVDY